MAGYGKQHKRVDKEAKRRYKADRKVDAALGGAMDSIMGDLASTTKGQRGKLTSSNERVMTRILALNARSKQANSKTLDSMENWFKDAGGGTNNAMTGGTMGGRYDMLGDVPRGEAKANAKLGKAEGQYGKDLSQSAKNVMGILGQTTEGIGDASDYLVAMTNANRARATATEVAAMHHEISMAKQAAETAQDQARLDAKLYRRNAEHAVKLAADELGTPGEKAMHASGFLVENTQSMIEALQNTDPATGQPIDSATAAHGLATAMGLAPDDPDRAALVKLAAQLIKVVGKGEDPRGVDQGERNEAIMSVIRVVPGWEEAGNHKEVRKYVDSIFKAGDADAVQAGTKAPSKPSQYAVETTQGTDIKVPTFDGSNGKEVVAKLTALGRAKGMDDPANWAETKMDDYRLTYWEKRLPTMLRAKFKELSGPESVRMAESILEDPMASEAATMTATDFGGGTTTPDGVSDTVWSWFKGIRNNYRFVQ